MAAALKPLLVPARCPLATGSIEAARSLAPGEGIRGAVSSHQVGLICKFMLNDPPTIPNDYHHVANFD